MQGNGGGSNFDSQVPAGVVELREDIPLKSGAGSGGDSYHCCGGGPKFILSCFAVLSTAITLALLTQIYYDVEEVVPHGSVSSSSAACSRSGTNLLKLGGSAVDAAAATALCLAVLMPHRTGFDASGSVLFWNYRSSHGMAPNLYEWGGPVSEANETTRPPRLITAMATLHSNFGVLPWSMVLQPAINFAKHGFNVSADLAMAALKAGNTDLVTEGQNYSNPLVAYFLEQQQKYSSSELAEHWNSVTLLRDSSVMGAMAGKWNIFVGGAGADTVKKSLSVALASPLSTYDAAFQKVLVSLQDESIKGGFPPNGVSSGLAVIDKSDNYVAMVTGLSKPFGSGPKTDDGWTQDHPDMPIDLAPAIVVDEHVCGTRYVIGAESSSALAEAATAILTSGLETGAIEKPRISIYPGGKLGIEVARDPPTVMLPAPLVNASLPYAAVNVVQQKGDALLSHADSRGGGLAFRF